MTKAVSWNIGKRQEPWRQLLQMDADFALLQEAGNPPEDVADRIQRSPFEPWLKDHYDRWPMIVKLSDRVEIEWFKETPAYKTVAPDEFAVSGIGIVAAARIIPLDGDEPFIAISMYARWTSPHTSTNSKWSVGYSDASAHRIISDLSAFIGHTEPLTHRILAAGDLNVIYGSTDKSISLPARDQTVFERMDALGLEFMGPQHPNGRRVEPTPSGLPKDTQNVPTYYASGKSPDTAWIQLDYAFASRGFHNSIQVEAMNRDTNQWGASDHCRLWIRIEPKR